MKTNREIRQEAWGIVRGKWFWRIFATGVVLYSIAGMVSGLIFTSYLEMGIQTWPDFLQAKVQAFQSGLGYAVPSSRVFWQMTGATAFQQFISYVFGAILLFGMAGVMLKAARDDDQSWFAGAFGGFKRPLEVTWLLVLMNFLVCLWGLLFIIPGIIAIYRYRQAWYLKSENPDWSARKCLGESSQMMKGVKWRAFCLDLSYVVRLLAIVLVSGIVLSGSALAMKGGPFVASLAAAATLLTIALAIGLLLVVIVSLIAARAVFYRELAYARACDLV